MRGLRKSWPATSRFVRPSATSWAMWTSCAVSWSEGARVAPARGLAAGAQLAAGALGPQGGAERLEALERGAQVGPRPRAAAQAAQELAEGELGARLLERAPGALVHRERGREQALGLGRVLASSARQCRATACPHGARLLSAHGSKASSHAVAVSVSPARTAASIRSSASQSIPAVGGSARACASAASGRPRPARAPRAPRWRDADVDQAPR